MHELEQSSSTPIDQKTLSQIETAVTPLLAQGIPAEQVAAGYRSWQASDSFSTTQIARSSTRLGREPPPRRRRQTNASPRRNPSRAASGNPWPTTRLELS